MTDKQRIKNLESRVEILEHLLQNLESAFVTKDIINEFQSFKGTKLVADIKKGKTILCQRKNTTL